MCFHNHLKIGLLVHSTCGYLKKKEGHGWNFHSFPSTIGQTFAKRFNAGQKPGYYQKVSSVQSVIIDHHRSV